MVDINLDKTDPDFAPRGFVPVGGKSDLHSALVCLYLSQVMEAARENVALINVSPTSIASLPQAGSIILALQSRYRSNALLN